METDDDSPIVLTKWPFYLGDGLLVVVAFAIAILGDWQLSDWQVVSCVLAVALGAGLFVLPYVVEFSVRSQEASRGRSAELQILKRQIQRAEDTVERAAVRIHQLEETLATQVQSTEVVSRVMDAKFARQEGELGALQARVTEAIEQSAVLSARLEEPAPAVTAVPDAETLQALRQAMERIEQMEQQLQLRAATLTVQDLADRLVQLEQRPVPVAAPPAEVAAAGRSMRFKRKRRTVEPHLLSRAIAAKQDSASSAVSRIIGQRVEPEVAAEVAAESEAVEASAAEIEPATLAVAAELPASTQLPAEPAPVLPAEPAPVLPAEPAPVLPAEPAPVLPAEPAPV
ncbi:MAG: hypothetical protein ACI81V_001066, partial [Lentimonas sp.]